MERKHYYAYNKTREAFLSLGVSIVSETGGSYWAALSRRGLKTNESVWISDLDGWQHASCNGPCDRIYLDADLRVISLVEGFLGLPDGEIADSCNSVLLLPVHTIFSSQTQPGDQILIGTIEEIGAILDGIESSAGVPSIAGGNVERQAMQSPIKWLTGLLSASERRRADRHPSPPIMAFYWDGGIPVPHPVPDISRTGLFVKTADRWHPSTLLRLTLQKKSNDSVQPDMTITLQCRVVRAGEDGVGMAYMLAERADGRNPFQVGQLASRKDLNRFFDQIVSEFNADPEPEHPFLPFPELSKQAESIGNETSILLLHDTDGHTTPDGQAG